MRSDAPPLLPIFRSRHQADLLAILLLHPDQDYTLTDLARRLGVPLSTLHGEAQRLIDAGLLSVRTVGRARLLRANAANRLTAPLTHLLTLTFGPHIVLAEVFAGVPGIERVLIFGSWAARYLGQPGPPPGDVDVLVVGQVERAAVYEAADVAQDRLGLPVNPTVCSPRRWNQAADALIQQIKASPTVTVLGPDGNDVQVAI